MPDATTSSAIDFSVCHDKLTHLPTRMLARMGNTLRNIELRSRRGQLVDRELRTWLHDADKGMRWVNERLQRMPSCQYDEGLPIVQAKDQIVDLLNQHQVIVVAGETGSGKTTQIPKICLELGRGSRGLIAHTQPRRLAATSVARRIADELGVNLGQQVGYAIRFDQRVNDDSLIALMTDGVLLQELRSDPLLTRYDTIIIDEAHERSLNIDLLLGYLKSILPRRPELKLIITSATIDPVSFSAFFNKAPVLSVSGRMYPVEMIYQPVDEDAEDSSMPARVLEGLQSLWAYGPGDVLVFLSGEGDIRELAQFLRKQQVKADVLPLYARLPMSEQQRVFQVGNKTRVVLATNVAETSLTVPGIRYVIDTGKARISRYSQSSRVQRLPVESISQAAANQRAGRCGRVMDGVCLRLYSIEDFQSRPEFTAPEMLRTSLVDLLLQMLALGLTDIESFPFLDAPDTKRISDGLRQLLELGAITEARKLTVLGRRMSALPLPPALARVLLAGESERSLHEMIILVAFLCLRDPRERPAEKSEQAIALHKRFVDPDSDFVAVLNLWKHIHERKELMSANAWKKELKAEFLNVITILEWGRLVGQLRGLAHEMNLQANDTPADYFRLHRALLTGLFPQIGQATRDGDYLGARGIRFVAHPTSGLHRKTKPWVVASDFLDGSKLYGMLLAKVEPDWIEQICAPLLKSHYDEPVWREQRGDAVSNEQVTLFGLKLVVNRPVSLSRINPDKARELFVRHGLLRNEIQLDLPFHRANQSLLKKVHEQEEKLRRRDLLRGEDELLALMLERLPAGVVDRNTLNKLAKSAPEKLQVLRLTQDEVMKAAAGNGADDFPSDLVFDGVRMPLKYCFAPGEINDGVTVQLPLSLLHSIPDDFFDALVPGLYVNKVEAVLRGLPKEIRKDLQPMAETAKEISLKLGAAHPPGKILHTPVSFWQSLSDALYSCRQMRIATTQLRAVAIADNLRMFIEIREGRSLLAKGRDLASLKAELSTRRAESVQQQTQSLTRSGVTEMPAELIPVRLSTAMGLAWLALCDEGETTGIRAYLSAEEAGVNHKAGVVRLYAIALNSDFRQYQKNNRALSALSLAAGAFPCGKRLLDEWLCAAIAAQLPESLDGIREQVSWRKLLLELPNKVRAQLAETLVPLADIFQLAAQMRTRIAKDLRPVLPVSARDCDEWLNDMLAPDFLRRGGLLQLKTLRRYLDALRLRIDQAHSNPMRETQRLQQYSALSSRYLKMPATPGKSLEQNEMQRLLREYRVSVFAQSVGTDGPVSEKRLEQQWQKLI